MYDIPDLPRLALLPEDPQYHVIVHSNPRQDLNDNIGPPWKVGTEDKVGDFDFLS